MGHASHFLERLDRLSRVHTEEALLLYNQAPLLKDVLDLARVPDGVGRVAIALGERGPYVVVTRDGAFVTCLGEGMSTKSLPIISRTQLDAFAVKHVELRRQMRRAAELADGKDYQTLEFIAKARRVGPLFSRELFMSIMHWVPVADVAMLRRMYEALEMLKLARETMNKAGKLKKTGMAERTLRSYWEVFWWTCNLSTLLASVGSTLLLRLPSDWRREIIIAQGWSLVMSGMMGPAARGAVAVARLGESVFDIYAEEYEQAEDPSNAFVYSLPFFAFGVRHPAMQADIVRALFPPGRAHLDERSRDVKQGLARMAAELFEKPGVVTDLALRFARFELTNRARLCSGRAPDPLALEDPDVLSAVTATSTYPGFGPPIRTKALILVTMWLAAKPLEELFAPERLLPHISFGEWRPELTDSLLVLHPAPEKPEPVRVEERPGRNDPCPCGSGKKHKKCCG